MRKAPLIADEILALAKRANEAGLPPLSDDAVDLLCRLSDGRARIAAIKKSETESPRSRAGSRATARPGARKERKAVNIDELAGRLRTAFNSDADFRALMNTPDVQGLKKDNVVALFSRVFEDARPLSKKLALPDMFSAFERERIKSVRSQG